MEIVVVIFIVLALIALGSVVTVGWVFLIGTRALLRWVGMIGSQRRIPPARLASLSCGNAACRAGNPVSARFCRRCGKRLGPSEFIAARQLQWARC